MKPFDQPRAAAVQVPHLIRGEGRRHREQSVAVALVDEADGIDRRERKRRAEAASLKFDFKTRAEHDAQRSPLDVTARQESICSQLQAHAKREHPKRPAARQNQS